MIPKQQVRGGADGLTNALVCPPGDEVLANKSVRLRHSGPAAHRLDHPVAQDKSERRGSRSSAAKPPKERGRTLEFVITDRQVLTKLLSQIANHGGGAVLKYGATLRCRRLLDRRRPKLAAFVAHVDDRHDALVKTPDLRSRPVQRPERRDCFRIRARSLDRACDDRVLEHDSDERGGAVGRIVFERWHWRVTLGDAHPEEIVQQRMLVIDSLWGQAVERLGR